MKKIYQNIITILIIGIIMPIASVNIVFSEQYEENEDGYKTKTYQNYYEDAFKKTYEKEEDDEDEKYEEEDKKYEQENDEDEEHHRSYSFDLDEKEFVKITPNQEEVLEKIVKEIPKDVDFKYNFTFNESGLNNTYINKTKYTNTTINQTQVNLINEQLSNLELKLNQLDNSINLTNNKSNNFTSGNLTISTANNQSWVKALLSFINSLFG